MEIAIYLERSKLTLKHNYDLELGNIATYLDIAIYLEWSKFTWKHNYYFWNVILNLEISLLTDKTGNKFGNKFMFPNLFLK